MLPNKHLQPIASRNWNQSPPKSTKTEQNEKIILITDPSCDQYKSSLKLNPQTAPRVVFQPSALAKLFMLPLPFFMVGCCTSTTTILQFDNEKKMVTFIAYPGFLKCCKKNYNIPFTDITRSKMLVAFNYRINKRQAFRLYLETSFGDFELTIPKNREQALLDKRRLDEVLIIYGILKDD